jgi:hypothetical protein
MVSPFVKTGKISVAYPPKTLIAERKATEIFSGFQIDVKYLES